MAARRVAMVVSVDVEVLFFPGVLCYLMRIMIMVVVMVVMVMPVAAESPNQEADPSEHQNHADYVPLPGLKRPAELKANQRDHAAQHNGREHVPHRCQEAGAGRASNGPSLRSRNHREWHPVVGQDGVEKAHRSGGNQEEWNRCGVHGLPCWID